MMVSFPMCSLSWAAQFLWSAWMAHFGPFLASLQVTHHCPRHILHAVVSDSVLAVQNKKRNSNLS